jgi:flagellar hook-length control protein FliK
MLQTNIADITSVQQASTLPVSSPEGEIPSGGSQFSLLVNQELNNSGNNNVSATPEPVIGAPVQSGKELEITGEVLLSMVNTAVTLNMMGLQEGLSNESDNIQVTVETPNGSSEGLLQTELSGDNGLKMGAVLYEMLNASLKSNNNALPANPVNESENGAVNEETTNGSADILSPAPSAIKEGEDKQVPGETPSGSENLLQAEQSGENGLKMGAVLYEMLNASVEASKDNSQTNATSQCSNENNEACQSQTKNTPSEHGLKIGILLSDPAADNGQAKGSISDSKNFLASLTQNINDSSGDTSANQLNLQKESADHSDNRNMKQEKSAHIQGNITGLNINEESEALKRPQNIITPEKMKLINNTDGLRDLQNNSSRIANMDAVSDSANPVNHSNLTLESGRAGEGIVSGQAARPSAFNQVLDSIVYVVKGNSRLGVSVDHGTLGKLDINLSIEKGMLNVHINTAERAAREFIENNMQSIVNSLEKEGVNVGGLSVALRERKGNEENITSVNGNRGNGEEIVHTEERTYAMNGLVNIFA